MVCQSVRYSIVTPFFFLTSNVLNHKVMGVDERSESKDSLLRIARVVTTVNTHDCASTFCLGYMLIHLDNLQTQPFVLDVHKYKARLSVEQIIAVQKNYMPKFTKAIRLSLD